MLGVIALIPDLFFASRVRSAAERAGVPLTVVSSLDRLNETLDEAEVGLVLIDLAARGVDVSSAIRTTKERGKKVIAFGPHKDLAARTSALEAGVDEWVTNQRLLEILAERFRALT